MSSINASTSLATTFLPWPYDSDSDSLCGRIAPYLKMGPGLICLVSSVIAVCCGIVWGAWWLVVIAGLGALGSSYAIYQGHQFEQLKTLEESNEELRFQLITFDNNNRVLERQTTHLNSINEQLGIQVGTLIEQNSQLQQTSNNLKDANRKQENLIGELSKQVFELTELRDTLYNQAKTHVKDLQNLQNSFGEIRNSAESDNKVFGEKVKILSKEIELLSTTRIQINGTSSDLEKKMLEQGEALVQAGKILNEAFTAIQKWKDEELVDKKIQQMENLNRQISNANQELKRLLHEIIEASNELHQTKGCLKELKLSLEGLQKIRSGFELALESLLEKIQLLGLESTNLTQVKNEICEAAKIFKEFQLSKIN